MITAETVDRELHLLKDFQRRTVDYVFRRMYLDDPPAHRFLIADEVGLGKTMVARGLIARAVHHLQDKVHRIDIVYLCSNAAIAQQNIQRLNALAQDQSAFATRLTLLPTQISSLQKNRINFVSFTPGTTLDLKSRRGKMDERAVLYRMLVGHFGLRPTPLRNLLQASASKDGWERHLASADGPLSEELAQSFRDWLGQSPVLAELQSACERFSRWKENVSAEDRGLQHVVIGALRNGLAARCIVALEPDLIILDEFQRFKDLLHGSDESAELARQLFDYPDARVLLLSATPYRMLTLTDETDDNHHRDFLETVRFLAGGKELGNGGLPGAVSALRQALLQSGPEQGERVRTARADVETLLRSVMCRTERVASTIARNAMLTERRMHASITRDDVAQAVEVDAISRLVGAGDSIEYWKSAPYLLSFMEGYELKRHLGQLHAKDVGALGNPSELRSNLKKASFDQYHEVPAANPRMRVLMNATVESGSWRLLWLPPSVPYIAPSGPYAGLSAGAATKALVFSSWHVVPKSIAVLLSYEAERRMIGLHAGSTSYERRDRRQLLTFQVDGDGRPTGMPALALLYPSATLAAHVDPLALALELGRGEPVPLATVRAHIATRVRPLVERIARRRTSSSDGPVDQRWYWAIPALLDQEHHSSALRWVDDRNGMRALLQSRGDEDTSAEDGEESPAGFAKHVDALLRVVRGEDPLGRAPDDLAEVVADFALASPAICAARALLRVSRMSSAWDEPVLHAAAQVAAGFRTLFNVPESISLLRGEDESTPYWRRVLEYCVDGNLQSVLDEYAHLLVETEGCIATPGKEVVESVSRRMRSALSPRTAALSVDEVRLDAGKVALHSFRIRSRYALRFGDIRDDDGKTVARAGAIRDAFNSPFRPFVLASTSVGQEGLDFHSYCHAVYHWNLPSNPVDLEQREGRVNRYKGHAVRRNVGLHYGLEALANRWSGEGDPWARLFELAAADRPAGANELIPYWVFETEGGVQVERRIPLLPMSREVHQIDRLKRQLAVYRLTFGQPRQDDLLAHLTSLNLPIDQIDTWQISLEPPKSA